VRIIVLIVSLSCLSCSPVQKTESHYEIINEALDIYTSEFLKDNEKLKSTRLNPVFVKLSPAPNYSDLQMLKNMHRYGRKRTYCKNYLLPIFDVDSHINYYEKQFNPSSNEFDAYRICIFLRCEKEIHAQCL